MAKIPIEPIPAAPKEYNQQYQDKLVRILQLALQRVNYTPEADNVRTLSKSWMGL